MRQCDAKSCEKPACWSFGKQGGRNEAYSCEDHATVLFNGIYTTGLLAKPYKETDGKPKLKMAPKAGGQVGQSSTFDPRAPAQETPVDSGGLRDDLRGERQILPGTIRPANASRPAEPDAGLPAVPDRALVSPQEISLRESNPGSLDLTDAQVKALRRNVDPLVVEVKPQGIIFVPWVKTAEVFDEVFRPGQWALVPLAKPMVQDNTVYAHQALFVGGKYVGEAIGEQAFQLGFHKLTYATAYEGAVSDAITRLSKRLGIFRELWDRRWVKNWLDEYAVRVEVNDRGKKWVWRRKDDPPLQGEVISKHQAESEWERPQTLDQENAAHIDNIE